MPGLSQTALRQEEDAESSVQAQWSNRAAPCQHVRVFDEALDDSAARRNVWLSGPSEPQKPISQAASGSCGVMTHHFEYHVKASWREKLPRLPRRVRRLSQCSVSCRVQCPGSQVQCFGRKKTAVAVALVRSGRGQAWRTLRSALRASVMRRCV